MLNAVELFAGAGGLGMGLSLAGFKAQKVVEWDRWAADTLVENQRRDFPLVRDWPIEHSDVRAADYSKLSDKIDLVSGGPPCQPFSTGGKHRGRSDKRDMFPATVDVIRQVRPRAFLIENVRGLTRASFANYYNYILLQLEHPEVIQKGDEGWIAHWHRLQAEHTSERRGLHYNVVPTLVDAADYGVPQKRARVFIVGFRSDLDVDWSFPEQTHSKDALITSQWITGDYWNEHHMRAPSMPSTVSKARLAALRLLNDRPDRTQMRWRTVRDALKGVPTPKPNGTKGWLNHKFQSGAKVYPGHTGSPYDLPAKALKAGAHGVPGGENMLVRDNGSVRYFTVRECARIQTFPDSFELHGAWSEAMRQLGNAVPMRLGHIVARSIAEQLLELDFNAIRTSMRPKGNA